MALGDGTAWDESTPSNATNISDGDDHIRDLRLGTRIRMAKEHVTPAASSVGGEHTFITLQAQATKPTLSGSQVAGVYVKDVGAGVMELYYEDEAGNEIKLTNGSGLNITAASAPRSSWSNMSVTRASASTVTITADDLVLYDASNNVAIINSVSQTPAITSSGAGGLDTGAEAANTIYYIWVIQKSSDSTVSAIFSTSSTAPTMPSGYDRKALVSAVGNNNSSDFINFTQTGHYYYFNVPAKMAGGNVGHGGWTSINLVPSNMSTNPGFVPSGLTSMCFGVFWGGNVSAYSQISNTNSASFTHGTGDPNKIDWNTAGGHSSSYFNFPILTANTLYYTSDNADSAIYLYGFVITKLT